MGLRGAESVNISYYEEQLKTGDYDSARFRLYSGRMWRIQGDIAFYKGDYIKAFGFYADAMRQINADGGFAWYSIERELRLLESGLKNHLNLDNRKYWVEQLQHNWHSEGANSLLLEWCRQQFQNIRVKESSAFSRSISDEFIGNNRFLQGVWESFVYLCCSLLWLP